MKLLTFSSLFPNDRMPSHGVFVENRLRHLVAGGRVEARVVAPVPWFPSTHPRFGRYARFAQVARRESRHGLDVQHPRYLSAPGVGMYSAPMAMALGARPVIARMLAEGYDFDVIDAHYFYPDGVAAALLSNWFQKPLVITARGSDIAQLSKYAAPHRMITWAARKATVLVTVCASLKNDLIALGVPSKKVHVLRNGVDLKGFVPIDRHSARQQLLLDSAEKVIASVGRLVPLKGHDLVIDALRLMPGVKLLIVGSGPAQAALETHAANLRLSDRVRFLGQIAHDRLTTIYSACDALVLASSNEGWANVLLESMACGTPVVATDVGGSREVVDAPEAGIVIERRHPDSIAEALRHLFAAPLDRSATRRYAEGFSWDDTTRGQERLFASIVGRPAESVCEVAS